LALVGFGAAKLAPTPEPLADTFSFGTFAATMMWVSLSYSGWNAAVYVAGEARDPQRNLPRSMVLATLAVTALYLGLNWIFVHAAPIAELAGQKDVAAVAARALGGTALESLVRAVLILSLITSVSSMVMIGPRVLARMADDGLMPRRLGFEGHLPTKAIWTQVVLSVGVLWASGLREQLTNLGWILSSFTALTVWGLLRLRKKEGAQLVPIPGYPFVPLLFLLATLTLTGTMLVVRGSQLLPALALIVSGALLYAFRRKQHGGSESDPAS
ncbi:MAG: APC family permease, partial [Planctomycetes bacterium]|nr:APC family permease [Planctomycetota bacterium]